MRESGKEILTQHSAAAKTKSEASVWNKVYSYLKVWAVLNCLKGDQSTCELLEHLNLTQTHKTQIQTKENNVKRNLLNGI